MNMTSKHEYVLFLLMCVSACTSFTTERESFVVATTEPANENSRDATNAKEDLVPIVPKIYDMKITANVSNRFAKTSVVSKVKNLAKSAQQATFSVVLPETAYISGFVMEIDGKSYQAYVKEKEEAKRIYNEAVGQGQAAAHVEANARDSNRFTVSVNVEPQKKAVFSLTYEELLQREDDHYEIVINIHPGQPVKDLNVEVNIIESKPLKFVKSPPLRTGNEVSKNDNDGLESHADIKVVNATSAIVTFKPNVERQKQLASGLGTKEENGLSGQFVVQYDVERDSQGGEILLRDGYFVHFFAPNELPALPKQVIFVLDTSGSMEGIRIKQLKEAMNSILSELKREDLFSIVEFNSIVKVRNVDNPEADYEVGDDPWRTYNSEPSPKKNTNQTIPPPYQASEENVRKAKQVIAKLNAYGGTDIRSALEVGLKLVRTKQEDKNAIHQPMVIFLTDGEPTVGETNSDRIVANITEIDGAAKAPIFSLSFGDYADRKFLQKLSLKNFGFSRHIYEAADASLQLQKFYEQISSPLLSDVTFKYVSNVKKLTKTVFPIYFSGSELVVAGVADEEFAPPEIHGLGLRGPVTWSGKVEAPVGDLERLWAYLTVKQILETRDTAEDKAPLTKKALDIALKYSFVTPVSSLVVVKPNDTSAVDTQDASRLSAAESIANRIYGINPSSFAVQTLSLKPQWSSSVKLGVPAGPAPLLPSQIDEDAVDEAFSFQYPLVRTTNLPTTTATTEDPYQDIQTKLPWLQNVLSKNGTLSIKAGNYQLATNDLVSVKLECPKTPINGTTGICTPLLECPQMFVHLTSVEVYADYFCPVENIYAGICCPKNKTS